jgi:hypothetical protein
MWKSSSTLSLYIKLHILSNYELTSWQQITILNSQSLARTRALNEGIKYPHQQLWLFKNKRSEKKNSTQPIVNEVSTVYKELFQLIAMHRSLTCPILIIRLVDIIRFSPQHFVIKKTFVNKLLMFVGKSIVIQIKGQSRDLSIPISIFI